MKRTKSLQMEELGYSVPDINGMYVYITVVSGNIFRYDKRLRAYVDDNDPDASYVLDRITMLDCVYVSDDEGISREAFMLQWRHHDCNTIEHDYIEL